MLAIKCGKCTAISSPTSNGIVIERLRYISDASPARASGFMDSPVNPNAPTAVDLEIGPGEIKPLTELRVTLRSPEFFFTPLGRTIPTDGSTKYLHKEPATIRAPILISSFAGAAKLPPTHVPLLRLLSSAMNVPLLKRTQTITSNEVSLDCSRRNRGNSRVNVSLISIVIDVWNRKEIPVTSFATGTE